MLRFGCKTLCAQFRTETSSMDSIILQGIPGPDDWDDKDILRLGIVQSVAGAGMPEDGNWCETFNMAGEVALTEGDVIVLRRFLDLWLGEEG